MFHTLNTVKSSSDSLFVKFQACMFICGYQQRLLIKNECPSLLMSNIECVPPPPKKTKKNHERIIRQNDQSPLRTTLDASRTRYDAPQTEQQIQFSFPIFTKSCITKTATCAPVGSTRCTFKKIKHNKRGHPECLATA